MRNLKDRLDKIIHKLADKENKSKEDQDLETSLIGLDIFSSPFFPDFDCFIPAEKKSCIIEELNKLLVSTEDSAQSQIHQAGMEVLSPLVFLDTCQLGSSENLTTLDEFLPIIGEDYFLPKEQSEDYIELPILHELGRNTQDILTNIVVDHGRS